MSKIDSSTVVWVTGASSGIGEAMTYEFAKTGAKLIISARRMEELERVKSNCPSPENVAIVLLDLSVPDSLLEKAQEAAAVFGPIDILVNNGGISHRDTVKNTDMDVYRRIMEINYFGAVALSKAVLPSMIERERGHQVIISSATGIISTPFRSAYAASKHALHGFYDALRAECHQSNVQVSIICPGFVKTNISINALKGDGSQQGTMDKAQEKGLSAQKVAAKIMKAVRSNTQEIYIGGFKEVSGIYLKRFWPKAFARAITKMAVT